MRPMFDAFDASGSPSKRSDDGADEDAGALRKRYRTIFMSDFPLGISGCQALALLEFLKAHPSDTAQKRLRCAPRGLQSDSCA